VGVELPDIPRAEFERRLTAAMRPGRPVPAPLAGQLHTHYEELRRWSPTVALVGPAFATEGIAQHYAESLAGLDLIPAGPCELIDIGSGAGFPGLVLAAARPDLEVTLIESRERKCAFLRSAARRMVLQVRCLKARLETPPPQGLPNSIDVVTVRAVRIDPSLLAPVTPRLSRDARVLLWSTGAPQELPNLALVGECSLAGNRRIFAYGVRP
jgi:16S rRNA (guanine527-N7)-methyltransferase